MTSGPISEIIGPETAQPAAPRAPRAPPPQPRRRSRHTPLTIVVAVLAGVGMCLGALAAVWSALRPQQAAPAFATIDATAHDMTQAQASRYLRGLQGQRAVDWQGWVLDVRSQLTGGYEAWIDMDPPGTPFSTQDVYLTLPLAADALPLRKGEMITFTGTIDSATRLLGEVTVHLADVTLRPTPAP